jgi:hypothetical protein
MELFSSSAGSTVGIASLTPMELEVSHHERRVADGDQLGRMEPEEGDNRQCAIGHDSDELGPSRDGPSPPRGLLPLRTDAKVEH